LDIKPETNNNNNNNNNKFFIVDVLGSVHFNKNENIETRGSNW
jgi:hypothetical protein